MVTYSKEKEFRLPQEEYRWSLYDYEVEPDGIRAVYKHDTGAWVAFRPDVTPPSHEAQIYTSDGEPNERLDADTESLIHLIETGLPIRLRETIEKGSVKDAYNFALLT